MGILWESYGNPREFIGIHENIYGNPWEVSVDCTTPVVLYTVKMRIASSFCGWSKSFRYDRKVPPCSILFFFRNIYSWEWTIFLWPPAGRVTGKVDRAGLKFIDTPQIPLMSPLDELWWIFQGLPPKKVINSYHSSVDWLKGKSIGNHRFSHEKWCFPANMFLQSNPLKSSISVSSLGLPQD